MKKDTTLVKVSLKLLDNPCLKFVDTQQHMYSQQAIELLPNPLIRLGTNIVLVCFYPQTLATVGINKTFPYCSRSTVLTLTVVCSHCSSCVLKIHTIITKRSAQHSMNMSHKPYNKCSFCKSKLKPVFIVYRY